MWVQTSPRHILGNLVVVNTQTECLTTILGQLCILLKELFEIFKFVGNTRSYFLCHGIGISFIG